MPLEIERKYLVEVDALPSLRGGMRLVQGYISEKPCVRVRLVDDGQVAHAYLTVKGPGLLTRPEFEYKIPTHDALDMLNTLCHNKISKTRHIIMVSGFKWEVDQFHGPLEGFWMAEIELPSEDTIFTKPPWALQEVSQDHRYTNISLAEYGIPQ